MRILLLLTLIAGLTWAEKPDFSGDWKMNPEKSDFGRLPKPAGFSRKIEHKDPNIHVVSTFTGPNGDVVTDVKYTTDGKESVNTVRGTEIHGEMKWEGDALALTTTRQAQGNALVTKERWTLSAGGKVLTSTSHTALPDGDMTIIMVMDKQ